MHDELLAIERELWTGGPDAYRRHLDDHCLVAFPGQAGLLRKDEIAKMAANDERWRDLQMTLQGSVQPEPRVALITYRASARRGDEPYEALVSSAYVERDGDWKLAFHQQTPLP